jgi:hypothetical protein
VVKRIITMFLSHFDNLEEDLLKDGWAAGYSNQEYKQIQTWSIDFANTMFATALDDMAL